MNFWENLRIALRGVAANRLRSFLTMLGIIIGVLAVIVGTGIGGGASELMLQKIQSLGSNSITIIPGEQKMGPVTAGLNQTLTPKDLGFLQRECPMLTAIAPQLSRAAQVKYGDKNTNTSIICTTPGYLSIREFSVGPGRFFTDEEVRGRAKVCIVGYTTAMNLFNGDAPLGRPLRIQGVSFIIIGIMAFKGSALFGDPDDQVVIPVTSGMTDVFGSLSYSDIDAQTAEANQADIAAAEIEVALRKSHRLRNDQDDDFTVHTQEEILKLQHTISLILTALLCSSAGVTLLVGGIGIMNIMLVSVTERTKEIGIRKAVGARASDIRNQFLIEAGTLSVLGGLIGIGGSYCICGLITALLHFPTEISPIWVLAAFGVSAAIGLFFGFYPAYTASMLDPIEALRYE